MRFFQGKMPRKCKVQGVEEVSAWIGYGIAHTRNSGTADGKICLWYTIM